MEGAGNPPPWDGIAWAGQLGRLDLASALLACVAIVLALGGLYAFIHFRGVAKRQAEEIATTEATAVAERIATEYIQAELPKIVQEQLELMGYAPRAAEADAIAQAQDDREPQ